MVATGSNETKRSVGAGVGDGGRGGRRPDRKFAFLVDLFAQVNADRDLIGPGRYTVYNLFIGLILIAVAAIVLVEPGHGPGSAGLTLGAIGLLLCAGMPVARFRTRTLDRLLVAQGAALVALSLAVGFGSVVWALRAPPNAPFRYAPGLTLVSLLYGTLQIAAFGGWPAARARRLRRAALLLGAACELALIVCLIVRLVRRP